LLAQLLEQHSPFVVQALPRVKQAAFRAAHLPLEHVWLQQSPLFAQAAPSEEHVG
jgi:hypothetical protein